MKCFHFTNNNNNNNHREPNNNTISRGVSWARSFSIASSASSRKSEFDFDSSSLSLSLSSSSSSTRPRANVLRVFTFSELKSATRGFSRSLVIGEGGFGCVFRGVVDGVDVAVKQLNRNGLQGHKEWINEVNFMGVVSHPNLVKLVGYCAEDDERGMQRLLVYELMHNRSLEDHLLARARVPSALPWMTRLKIAQDAANGLAYLHEEMDFQLIFRDFKTSNILLDEDFNAKLSDFGLARQGPPEGLSHVSTAVVGTVGYAAPEYIHTGRLTSKSDVWSFGVVLYELITGRRAVERNRPRCEQKLLEWAKPYASDSKKFYLIVDPQLEGNYCIKSALKVASLANRCLMKQPKLRPKMSEVVEILGSIIDATLSQDERISRSVCEIEDVQEEGVEETNTESKQRSNYRKKVLDMKEMIILRNKSIGKLDWRNWTHGVVRTW